MTVLLGWGFRRLLDRFHLLLIPRAGVLLTLIVLFLLAVIMTAGRAGVGFTALVPRGASLEELFLDLTEDEPRPLVQEVA